MEMDGPAAAKVRTQLLAKSVYDVAGSAVALVSGVPYSTFVTPLRGEFITRTHFGLYRLNAGVSGTIVFKGTDNAECWASNIDIRKVAAKQLTDPLVCREILLGDITADCDEETLIAIVQCIRSAVDEGSIHVGFLDAAVHSFAHRQNNLWQALHSWLAAANQAAKPLTLELIGHSLGGAMATVAAAVIVGLLRSATFRAAQHAVQVLLTTFGSPRVFSLSAAKALEPSIRVYRFVSRAPSAVPYLWLEDPVTLTPRSLSDEDGFEHVGEPVFVSVTLSAKDNGETQEETGLAAACVQAGGAYINLHKMDSYIASALTKTSNQKADTVALECCF